MFTDSISVKLIAGRGGHGIVCWRREKYLPKGGPTGGNGGRGGNILIEGDENIPSLDSYRSNRLIRAEKGLQGGPNQRQGRQGRDLVLKVPCGTLVKDKRTKEVLFDITAHKQSVLICEGGKGGRGNASFKTSVKQAPNYCTFGKDGEEKEIEFDLKVIADIGLVGFPNAGKSTFINQLTEAHAKCDNYPFTTLSPNLGFFETADYMRYSIADIPGIIEGAHQNKGLGLKFLKHIERTKILFYILDITKEDPLQDFKILQDEIRAHDPKILDKPSILILNKCDEEHSQEEVQKVHDTVKSLPIYTISAQTGEGVDTLLKGIISLLEKN